MRLTPESVTRIVPHKLIAINKFIDDRARARRFKPERNAQDRAYKASVRRWCHLVALEH